MRIVISEDEKNRILHLHGIKSLEKYSHMIDSIDDERGYDNGVWVYLKKEYADFDFDPYGATRQIHEYSIRELLRRFKGVRRVTKSDIENYENLQYN